MGARCFTWNNWRGSGKCEKARERLKRRPRAGDCSTWNTRSRWKRKPPALGGLGFRGRIQGQPSQDRRLQLQQARKLLAQWFSRNADEECSTRDP